MTDPRNGALARSRSTAELTRAFLGRSFSHAQLDQWLEGINPEPDSQQELLWVGSVGYEKFPQVDDFAAFLQRSGVERLVDVRELPNSRRRGFAKTALGEALSRKGIEYIHLRAMGNPKEFRDLYKGGRVDDGRKGYTDHLLESHRDDLNALAALLEQKRSALMCVEHEQSICHRDVIFTALETEVGMELEVAPLGQS